MNKLIIDKMLVYLWSYYGGVKNKEFIFFNEIGCGGLGFGFSCEINKNIDNTKIQEIENKYIDKMINYIKGE